MKIRKAAHTTLLFFFSAVLLSFFSLNYTTVSAEPSHEPAHHSESTSVSNCQNQCSAVSFSISSSPKETEHSEKKLEQNYISRYEISAHHFYTCTNPSIQTGADARVLRPPDIHLLNCIFRQ